MINDYEEPTKKDKQTKSSNLFLYFHRLLIFD